MNTIGDEREDHHASPLRLEKRNQKSHEQRASRDLAEQQADPHSELPLPAAGNATACQWHARELPVVEKQAGSHSESLLPAVGNTTACQRHYRELIEERLAENCCCQMEPELRRLRYVAQVKALARGDEARS